MNIAELEFELAEMNKHEQAIAEVGYTDIKASIQAFLNVNNIGKSVMRLLKITYRNRNVLQLILQHDKYNVHTNYTREKLQKISNKLSSYLADHKYHGMMSTSLQFSDLGWRSGYLGQFGSAIQL